MRYFIAAIALAAVLAPSPAQAQKFENGMALPVFEGQPIIKHNVWVEIPSLDTDRDGINDRIRVQISRPQATDSGTKLPVVMSASPYSGGTMQYPRYEMTVPLYVPGVTPPAAKPGPPPPISAQKYYGTEPPIREINTGGYATYFLPRGFIWADAQSLGTGNSTGCPTIGGHEENLAMKAVIDWFNGQGRAYDAEGKEVKATWTTGATAMIGASYVGTLPIGAASLGVAGLKAIVPIAGVSSYYDHRRSYGAIMNSFPTMGTDAPTLFDNVLSRKYPEACAYMRELIVDSADRRTGDYNVWWDDRNYVKDAKNFKTAVLISHGLNDFNVKPRNAARLWEALKANNIPAKIWWNQGGHGDGANSAARRDAWRDQLNRFWTKYLFGIENGVMNEPKVAIERENRQWVEYADWPVPGSSPTTLYFAPGAANAIGQLGVPRIARATTEVIIDDATKSANVLLAAPESPNRLVYQTPALTAPVHVSGIPRVTIQLAIDKPAANVSAMLVDYKATGAPFIVVRGWADPQNRESIEKTTPVVPGTSYKMTFELQPHDYIFPAGSRIGLMLLSSDSLFTVRPPAGTRLTVSTHQSSFELPIVGGDAAWSAAVKR